MMMNILIYFIGFLSILFLPERIWNFLWDKSHELGVFIEKTRAKNPFLRQEQNGQRMLNFFPELEAKMAMGLKSTALELPEYKFYTALLLKLLEVHRKLGIALKHILPELRQNLIKDLQFEKKLNSSIVGGNLQFLVITLTTWSFIFLSSSLADLPLLPINLVIIFSVQILGMAVFNAALRVLKRRTFARFAQSIERLYLFVSLAEVGLPVSQVLVESRVLEGDLVQDPLFLPCARRLSTLVNRWKEQGLSPKVEAAEITRELWHLKEVCFERFLKHLDGLKFVVLAFFFLPAYFFYLYSIFQFFMEQ